MANRACRVCLVLQEKRVTKESKGTREWMELVENQDCLESLDGME